MTHQGTAHPFDRRIFLAGSGALALLTTGGAAFAQEGGKASPRAGSCGRFSPTSSSVSISSRCRRR